METVVNQPFLTKRGKIGRWGSLIGLGALFAGLITAGQQMVLISYTCLLIGLIGASVGSYMANRYVKEPRADQRLAKALESLDRRHVLYSYYLPSEQVLFSHHGLTVLEVRNQEGAISYADGRWRHKAGLRKFLQFFGEPSLGRPEQDLEREMGWMRDWLAKNGMGEDVPVNGVIVFTNPGAELDIQGLAHPYATLEELPEVIRAGFGERPPLSTSKRNEIRSKLDDLVAQA
jgi:hypothetical protein